MRVIKWNDKGGNDMILNVDGSNLGNSGVFGFGGLLENEDGASLTSSLDLLKI